MKRLKISAGTGYTSSLRNERGSVLLIVLVTLVGITALAAAGMVITDTELRSSENQEAGTNAFYIADAGLQQYLGTRDTATTTDTLTYAVGSTIVQGEKLLDMPTTNGDHVLYRVRSVSSYSPPEGGSASRTVSQGLVRRGQRPLEDGECRHPVRGRPGARRQPGLPQLAEA